MCGELTTLPVLSKKTLFKLGQRGRVSGPFLLQVEYSRVTTSPVSFRGLGAALDWRTRTLVEDDFLISMDLKEVFTDAGAEVVGPCHQS